MKRLLLAIFSLATMPLLAQQPDAISDTRIGGVRQETVERAQKREDPEVRSVITQTSKDTGISRGKLLTQFNAARRDYAKLAAQQQLAPAPALSVQQFAQAKVASLKLKIPMNQILTSTLRLKGNVGAAVQELQAPPPQQPLPPKVPPQASQPPIG